MSRSTDNRKTQHRLLIAVALSFSFTVLWWPDHRERTGELRAVGSELQQPASPQATPASLAVPSVEALRSQNDDLIHFIDDAYKLLYEKGIHIQLDVEKTADGHLRLRADSVALMAQLEAKLQKIDQPASGEEPD